MSFSTCNHWSLFYPVCPLREAGWSVVMLQLIPHAATSAESQVPGGTFGAGKHSWRGSERKELWHEVEVHLQPCPLAALWCKISPWLSVQGLDPGPVSLRALSWQTAAKPPHMGQGHPPSWHHQGPWCQPSHPLLSDPWPNPPTAARPEPSFRRQRFLMDSLIVCFQNTVTSMGKIGSNWLASYENKFQCLETEHNFKCYHPTNHVLPLLVFHFSGMNLGQFCICPIYFIYTCSLYLHTQMGDICLFSFGQAIVLLKWKCAGFGIQLQHMFKNER